MAIYQTFEYIKAASVAEINQLLAKHGSDAKILSGGTDLIVKIKENIEHPKILIDIKGISELNQIIFQQNEVFIGANVTFSQLIADSNIKHHFPLIWEASTTVASIGTRNRATIVGNICSAVPSLDSGPALLVYDAMIIVNNQQGERQISIHDWFLGPKKTALLNNEWVKGIKIQLPQEKNGTCYTKLGRYRGEDLAQAGLAVLITEKNEYRMAFCALGPVPKRARLLENEANSKNLTPALIQNLINLVEKEINPITDIRSTKEYRLHIAKVMIERALTKANQRLHGEKLELTNLLGG